ncbi:putative tricarboxylic transport membrane protein [Nocardiopsis flavescens]|uniref:Putative tricarboxylic transport membrane protein n=1 Tax=Nocardiopsis flavescens TaxID=758803 RepID=A0A1M6C507_9ACTN|nr:tripartite tricarboxylate transporter TctB family protein [Nocardiopsis flavescens]SHI55818.1 putative tricarboxylic transport membrane protein [Nocardiopsis flavescens]
MTTHRTTDAAQGAATATGGARAWWRGRSEIFVGLLTVGIGAFLAVQTASMHVPDNSASPGPQLFPALVAALMIVLGSALALQVARRPAPEPDDGGADRPEGAGVVGDLVEGESPHTAAPATHSDWRTVGTVLGSVVLFALLLQPVGWLLSGALLFFGVAWAFGGRRPLFEATVALVYSSVVQLAFVAGLGLNLPSGILGGVL